MFLTSKWHQLANNQLVSHKIRTGPVRPVFLFVVGKKGMMTDIYNKKKWIRKNTFVQVVERLCIMIT